MSLQMEPHIILVMHCWVWKFGTGLIPHLDMFLLLKIDLRALLNSISLEATVEFQDFVPVANLTCFLTSDQSSNAIALVFSSTSVFFFCSISDNLLNLSLVPLIVLDALEFLGRDIAFLAILGGFLSLLPFLLML